MMQGAPIPLRPAAGAAVLLAGLGEAEAADLAFQLRLAGLSSLSLPVHEALAELMDDPVGFLFVVLDAQAFADDEALADALRLLSLEPARFRAIVVNHPDPQSLTRADRHRNCLELALGGIEEPVWRETLLTHCRAAARLPLCA
ncbi:MAG: hypothetical protein D6811_12295 [Alphaproteobacteria bacterium]|nr:MAG: hypothetical protein D6811_12295 [Alphaproteobacteria bacterium]